MNTRLPKAPVALGTRRDMLLGSCASLGSVALSWLLAQGELRASQSDDTSAFSALRPRQPHFSARAKSIIYLVM
ncbi:MAG: hypothetical protein QF918_04525, partial [Pirellulaceae bacterium]|nr:hypothetical protein [Pirellulaceae bacterium]